MGPAVLDDSLSKAPGIKSAIAGSECIAYPSMGFRLDLRLTGEDLIVEEELIHLSIFSATGEVRRNRSNIQIPQRREDAAWAVMSSSINTRDFSWE